MLECCGCGMKERDRDGMRTWKKYFSVRGFCVYIGCCWPGFSMVSRGLARTT